MPKYRKKPVVIEAIHFMPDGKDNLKVVKAFLGENQTYSVWHDDYTGKKSIMIQTLEGTMEAKPGDYIIRGIKGEYYPCKPDIFEESYELFE